MMVHIYSTINKTKNGVQTVVQSNKDFWKLIKPFLTNKGFLEKTNYDSLKR